MGRGRGRFGLGWVGGLGRVDGISGARVRVSGSDDEIEECGGDGWAGRRRPQNL
jgi:hypothetical protein